MTVKIVNQITSKKRYYPGVNPCNGATAHMTANTRIGADAQAHADLQSKGNVALASWHVTIDDKAAFQSYLDSRQCWHAGDGRGPGNTTTISYELCVNSDGDYVQMIHNAAERIAMDVIEHGWSRSGIKQHEDYSPWGKDCPRELRGSKADISWDDFLAMIFAYAGAQDVKPKPKPEERDKADQHTDADGYWGTDTSIEMQYELGTPIDGEVWHQSSHWLDANPALTWGWKASTSTKGSPLIYALYDFLAEQGVSTSILGKRDGKIGPKHIRSLQTWLRNIGNYHGAIDGELWKESATVKALQRAINDGKIHN
jgi:hypothetical protein